MSLSCGGITFCVLIPDWATMWERTLALHSLARIRLFLLEPLPAVCFPDCVLHSEDQGKPSVSFWVSRGQFMSDGG